MYTRTRKQNEREIVMERQENTWISNRRSPLRSTKWKRYLSTRKEEGSMVPFRAEKLKEAKCRW